MPNSIRENKWFPDWKPFNMLYPADQKFMWTAVGTGGAAKIKKMLSLLHQSDKIDKANIHYVCIPISWHMMGVPAS